jgi:hypothetical protein
LRTALLVAGGLSALALAALLTSYSSIPKDWSDASSFSATHVGLLVSLGGFAVTWWQLTRTQEAAAAAKRAVIRLKGEIAAFDAIGEIRTAKAAADEAQAHVVSQRWEPALMASNRLLEALQKVRSGAHGLGANDTARLEDYISQSLDACVAIERATREVADLGAGALTGRLREINSYMVDLEYRLKDRASGSETTTAH